MLDSTDLIISCEKKARKRAMGKEYRFSKQGSSEVQEGKKEEEEKEEEEKEEEEKEEKK
jgi:hypothetical protein